MVTAYMCAHSASGVATFDSSNGRAGVTTNISHELLASENQVAKRNAPDILDRRWFCSGYPGGLPTHNETIQRDLYFDYAVDKRQFVAIIQKQLRLNKHNYWFCA